MLNRTLTVFALLGLALQIAVPPGFMPSGEGSGWYLKWCPEGMSPAAMHALFGHAHHHHHQESEPSYNQCDLGGIVVDADVQRIQSEVDAPHQSHTNLAQILVSALEQQNAPYHSRAPPSPLKRRTITAV